MYINREIQPYLVSELKKPLRSGFIISGIVGCGKTTLIEKVSAELASHFQSFFFTGDDSHFRQVIVENSRYLLEEIAKQTSKRSLIIVDEVQKTPEVFDALKIAFDEGHHSFIVSGSNPFFLSSIAKKRLQRRAEQILLLPISLSELIANKFEIPISLEIFNKILWEARALKDVKLPSVTKPEIKNILDKYLLYGGLPLALQAKDFTSKLKEIRLTVERGFELMTVEGNYLADRVRTELAQLNSREFAYKNILEKTRLRRREPINNILNELIHHGYIIRKKPVLLKNNKDSYLQIFSYIDPGISTYLYRDESESSLGFQLESYVHSRLNYRVVNSVHKSELGYYKNHKIEKDSLRFTGGEIDFVMIYGKRIIPIEVKMTDSISQIDLKNLKLFSDVHHPIFSIVIYGGAPYIDLKSNVLYWPYWMI